MSHVQVTADRTSEEGRDGVASEVAMAIGEASDEEDETPVGRVTGHAGERQGSEVAGGTKRKLDQDVCDCIPACVHACMFVCTPVVHVHVHVQYTCTL